MAESDQGRITERLVSRRTMLISGAAVAGAVWVTPGIETIGTAASASTSPPPSGPKGQGFSFVTLLLKAPDGTYYRFKFGSFPDTVARGQCVTVNITDSGPKFSNGDCFSGGTDPTQPTDSNATIAKGYPSNLQGQYCANAAGRQSFTLTNQNLHLDFTLEGWAVHQGNCCAGGTATTSTPATYKAPTGDLSGDGSMLVFMAPGNGPTCA